MNTLVLTRAGWTRICWAIYCECRYQQLAAITRRAARADVCNSAIVQMNYLQLLRGGKVAA